MRTYSIELKGKTERVTSDQLKAFRTAYVRSAELDNRLSELLWLDLFIYDKEFGINPQEILTTIYELEDGERNTGLKPASAFQHPPLKGLWHKHFFSAYALVPNIILGLGKHGTKNLAEEILDPNKSPVVTQEMISEFARRVAEDPVEERFEKNKLTGEWIIFHKQDGVHYYLCCNTHAAGDQFIYDRILQHCTRDFPNLPDWLQQLR